MKTPPHTQEIKEAFKVCSNLLLESFGNGGPRGSNAAPMHLPSLKIRLAALSLYKIATLFTLSPLFCTTALLAGLRQGGQRHDPRRGAAPHPDQLGREDHR